MGAYIVGMITGTVCLVVSLCYLGHLGQVQVPLAIGTGIVGAVVLLLCTVLVARASGGPARKARPKESAAEPEPEPVEMPSMDDDA